MVEIILLVITGFFVGLMGYLLGLGGGALIVPVLVLGYKYPMHEAVGTSLIVITATSLALAAKNIKVNLINLKLAVELELITIAGALAGSFLGVQLSSKILTTAFASILVITGIMMWRKKNPSERVLMPDAPSRFRTSFRDAISGKDVEYDVINLGKTYAVSGAAGFISGLLGLGGGVFKVPAMNLVSKIPIKAATATSSFMIGFTAAAGSIAYLNSGFVEPVAAGTMIIGVSAGSYYATKKLTKVKDKRIQQIFVLFIFTVAIQMVIKAF